MFKTHLVNQISCVHKTFKLFFTILFNNNLLKTTKSRSGVLFYVCFVCV